MTDGLYKHEWNIIIGYLERAMEVLTGVDASGVDPLHLHEPAHRGGVNLTIVDAAADGVDGLHACCASPMPSPVHRTVPSPVQKDRSASRAPSGIHPTSASGASTERRLKSKP